MAFVLARKPKIPESFQAESLGTHTPLPFALPNKQRFRRHVLGPDVVLPVNPRDIAKRDKKVRGFHLGACYILPNEKGIFINALSGDQGGPHLPNITGEHFHVEDPPAAECFGEEEACSGADTENLGAALGIIDRQAQNDGDDGREDSTQVVAGRAALHLTSEKFYAGAHYYVQLRSSLENSHQLRNGIQRRRQIRIPVTQIVNALLHGDVDTRANCLRFAPVRLALEHHDAIFSSGPNLLEHIPGVVTAAVVHKDEFDARLAQKTLETGNGQTAALIVT